MQIPVLVEPVASNSFRAGALGYSAEGPTKDEAVAKLKTVLHQRIVAGAEIVFLSLPGPRPPAGDLQGDPMFADWVKEMAEYRRERDKELEDL